MDWHAIEATSIVVCLVAAVIYLVIEVFDLRVWWCRRRTPPDPPKRPPGIGETWPEDRREEAEEHWRRMLDEDKRV
jgi:hypothetical protein